MEIELAIYEDCLSLIEKFARKPDQNFKTFCQEWHNAMFQHVYAAQTSAIEVIQTTKTILDLAKRIVCAKDELGKLTFQQNYNQQITRRFGGIFLMHAAYFKQPTNRYAKVLISNETWRDLLMFIELLPENTLADEVRYIFWNLYKEDAFRFTVFDYDLGLENLVDYDRLYDIYNGHKHVDVVRIKLKQKLMAVGETEKLLPNLVSLEEYYNNSKDSLGTHKSAKHLPSTKIFQDINDAIKCIHNILDETDNEHTYISPNRLNNELKKELKRKAVGYTTKREQITEENSQQEETKLKFGRPTVRQLMTQELPEFLQYDLKNNSSEDED